MPDGTFVSGVTAAVGSAGERAANNASDQLLGVGVGFTVLLFYAGLMTFLFILQFRRNSDLVDKMFNLIPQATQAVENAVRDFKESANDLIAKIK